MIARPLNASVLKKARGIGKWLEPMVSHAVEDFFRSVVPFMGKDDSLPAEIAPPWHPLSLDYVRRKGSAEFWAYTFLLHGPRPPRSVHDLLHGTGARPIFGGASLISTMETLSGERAFGKTKITVTDWQGMPARDGSDPPPAPSQVEATLVIAPWGSMTRLDAPHLEHYLEHKGIIDHATRIKLTAPNGIQRALLRPLLVHYSNVVIPRLIEAALRERFRGLGILVRVARPFSDEGPY